MKRWLSKPENRKEIPWDQLQIVLDQVNSNEIGIQGNGVFTITYGLVASVRICTLLITDCTLLKFIRNLIEFLQIS